MTFGIVCLVVANLATLAAARGALERVATDRPYVNGLLFVLIRLALISAIVLLAGLTALLRPWGLLLVSLIPLVWLRPHMVWRWPRVAIPRDAAAWLLVIAGLVVAARLLVQAWVFVPYSADALSYHLPKVAEWVRAGQFTRQLGVDTHAAFPAGFELIEAWWVTFLHHDVLIEMAGIEFLVLAVTAAFALTPGLHMQATAALNDLPMTALVAAAAALLALGVATPLVLMPIGLGIGIKGTFLFVLPGLALLWLLVDREQRLRREAVQTATVLAVIALAAGGFWYARNAVWFGNPLHPMTTRGVTETGGYVTIRYGVSVSGAAENFSELVESRIGDREAAYSALSRKVSGWGALAFACGLPAMLIMLRRDARFRHLIGGLGVSLVSVLLLVQHDDWFARFVLFFSVVPVLATAAVAARERLVLLIAIPALALQFASTMIPEELDVAKVEALAAQPWRTRTLATVFDADMTGLGDAVGYYADNVGEAYWCYGSDYSWAVAYLRATSAAGLAEEMKNAGVQSLYAVPGTAQRQQVLSEAVRAGYLRRERRQIYSLADRPSAKVW